MIKKSESILMVMGITILSKGVGFIREIALASIFGTTAYTDAYLVARTITLGLFSGLGGALSTGFIPLYTNIIQKYNKTKALKFTNNLLHIVIILTIILSGIGILFSESLVNLFAVGFKGETLKLSIKFTRILLPGMIVIGVNFILTGYLEANKRFNIPALIAFPNNIILITAIFLSSIWNKDILIYGTLLGMLSQFLFQYYFVYRTGYSYQLKIQLRDRNIKKLIYLVMPIFLGMTVQQINTLVDRTLASTLIEGSIAALNFADRLNLFVYGVFTASIATVIYPFLSQLAAQNDQRAFKNSIIKSINFMCILILPISIGSMCLCKPIVKVLFQRGAFDTKATQMTSIALFYYSIGMIGFGLRHILSKIFYALQDSKTPMINGAIAVVINILLNFILIGYMQHAGLALATSISSLVGTILLLYRLKLKLGSFGGKKILKVTAKVLICSLIMGIGVKIFYHYTAMTRGTGFINEVITLISSILFGGFIYFILILFMQIEEVNDLFNRVRNKMKRYVLLEYADERAENQKLLFGLATSKSIEMQKNVYNIIRSLPTNKYDITVLITQEEEMLQWITQFNQRRMAKATIITMPSVKCKIQLFKNIRMFLELYKLIKKERYDIVHFHSDKVGIVGCWAALFARAPKIFCTIYHWHMSEYQLTLKKKIIAFLEKLTGKLITKSICISNAEMKQRLNNKWIIEKKACVIYQSFLKYPSIKKEKFQALLETRKKVPIIGMIAPMDDPYNPLFLIKIFYELKKRGYEAKLVIIGDGRLKDRCAGYIYDLGLNLEVFLFSEDQDTRTLISDFEIFTSFSHNQMDISYLLDAMAAQKPIITNFTKEISEFVYHGRNGYLLESFDIDQGIKYMENLLKHPWLRKEMGRMGREIACRRFNKERMIREYEEIYTPTDPSFLKLKDK
ncbi:murein biosynthesis integral membrane protein MurJ [Clostridiaceae bacterium 35-E11]